MEELNHEEDNRSRCAQCFEWRGCCSFPHGRITGIALAAAIVCWFLTGLGVGGCDMVKVDGTAFTTDYYEGRPHGKLIVPKHYGLGPYMRQNIDMKTMRTYNETTFGPRCVAWSPSERHNLLDAGWKASMGFATLATICISLGSYVLCAFSCCANPCGLYCWNIEYTKAGVCLLFGLASLFQLLTFSAYGSDIFWHYHAKWSTGSYIIVVGMILSFLTAILIRPQKSQRDSAVLKDLAMDVSCPEPDYAMNVGQIEREIPVESMMSDDSENHRSLA